MYSDSRKYDMLSYLVNAGHSGCFHFIQYMKPNQPIPDNFRNMS